MNKQNKTIEVYGPSLSEQLRKRKDQFKGWVRRWADWFGEILMLLIGPLVVVLAGFAAVVGVALLFLLLKSLSVAVWCLVTYVLFACLIGDMTVSIGGRLFDVWLLCGIVLGLIMPGLTIKTGKTKRK